MNITPSVLVNQAKEALERWPFIPDLETRYGLPRWLLLAVGSRETNLGVRYTQGATGDGGHGHGVWQKDDRFHPIPAGFDLDARLQAETAAAHLAGLYAAFPHNENAAVASYNAGVGGVRKAMQAGKHPDMATTGHDYSRDVLERRGVLDRALDHQPHPQPEPQTPAPVVVPEPVLISRLFAGGNAVHVEIVSIPTDANGDGSAPAPAGFLAVSDAGSHDKYDPAATDADSIVVPVGARASDGGMRLVVAGGPRNTTVGAPVLVAD